MGSSKFNMKHDDQKEQLTSHGSLSLRLCRRLYFNKKSRWHAHTTNSLPLLDVACRMFSAVAGGRLDSLSRRDASEMTRGAGVSPTTVLLALVYLERLTSASRVQHQQDHSDSSDSSSEYLRQTPTKHVFIGSVLVAGKYLHDDGEEEQMLTEELSNSSHLTNEQINKIEMNFLAAIDWRLHVTCETFAAMLVRVETMAALCETRKRGCVTSGLTYSEVISLTSQVSVTHRLLVDALLKVLPVCSLAYLASLITMLSSFLLVFHTRSCLIPHSPLQQLNTSSSPLCSVQAERVCEPGRVAPPLCLRDDDDLKQSEMAATVIINPSTLSRPPAASQTLPSPAHFLSAELANSCACRREAEIPWLAPAGTNNSSLLVAPSCGRLFNYHPHLLHNKQLMFAC